MGLAVIFLVIFFFAWNRLIAFQCISMGNGASTYRSFRVTTGVSEMRKCDESEKKREGDQVGSLPTTTSLELNANILDKVRDSHAEEEE